jgi:hypothetical protein
MDSERYALSHIPKRRTAASGAADRSSEYANNDTGMGFFPRRNEMLRRVSFLLAVITILVFGPAFSQEKKPFTNADVLQMTKSEFQEAMIVKAIEANDANFDVSVQGLTDLKNAGVSQAVIEAMLAAESKKHDSAKATKTTGVATPDPNDPRSPHDSGIYCLAKQTPEKHLVRVEPSSYPGQKAKPGFMSATVKAVIPGPHAALRISEAAPEFWFYFDEKSTGLGQSSSGASKPEDFVLAKMDMKSKDRELVVARATSFGGVSNGVRPEDVMPVDVQKVAQGIYKVTPVKSLAAGEYCFLPSGGAGAFVGYGGRVYDFGIDSAK